MATSAMSSSIGRGCKNYVPQPKPSYAPVGYQRCEHCNCIVAEGARCDCYERESWDGVKPVKVSRVAPSKRKYEKVAERRPKVYTFASRKKEPKPLILTKREQSYEKFKCQRCGLVFDGAHIGRKPKYCPACRVEVRREYDRQRPRRNRRN